MALVDPNNQTKRCGLLSRAPFGTPASCCFEVYPAMVVGTDGTRLHLIVRWHDDGWCGSHRCDLRLSESMEGGATEVQ